MSPRDAFDRPPYSRWGAEDAARRVGGCDDDQGDDRDRQILLVVASYTIVFVIGFLIGLAS